VLGVACAEHGGVQAEDFHLRNATATVALNMNFERWTVIGGLDHQLSGAVIVKRLDYPLYFQNRLVQLRLSPDDWSGINAISLLCGNSIKGGSAQELSGCANHFKCLGRLV
jgi:hypothetical protein